MILLQSLITKQTWLLESWLSQEVVLGSEQSMLPKLLKLTEMTSLWRSWKDYHPFKQILGRLSQKSKLSRLKRKRRVMRSLMMSHLFREKKPTGKARPLLRMDPGNSGERKKRLQLETFLSQTKKQLQVQEQP